MSNAHLYVAVREAAAGTFDVLGELGESQAGGMVYLAREMAGNALVVLKLEPAGDGTGGMQYYLDVARELDASVPDVELRCPRCRATLRQWARFCTQCGLDVSGEAPASGEHASRAALREKVRAATEGQYEFLGDIPRAEGGGLVYFARDLSDGQIVALRLQKDLNRKFEVGVTRTLKAVEADVSPAAGAARRPAVTIVQRAAASPGPAGQRGAGGRGEAGGAAPAAAQTAQATPAAVIGGTPTRPPVLWISTIAIVVVVVVALVILVLVRR